MRNTSERVRTRHFLLRGIPSASGQARLGLAVSRKVSKRAVVRNQIKRIVRESFRLRRETLPAMDVLVIAQPSAADAPNPALHADLEYAWQKLTALKPMAAPGTICG